MIIHGIPSLATLTATVLLCACSHTHFVHNATDAPLYGVTVTTGSSSFRHGTIIPESCKSYSGEIRFKKAHAPNIAWETPNGGLHEHTVKLSRNPGSRYETHFVIKDGEVNAFFYPAYPTQAPVEEYLNFLVEIGVDTPERQAEAARTLPQPCQRPDCPRCGAK